MEIPLLKLCSGGQIPALGFGTYDPLNEPGKCYTSVRGALEAGYRHLDCAAYYLNESEAGNAIYDFLQANPSVSRKDLFITTKVWNHLHEPKDVEWSLRKSLKELRLDYVDLFLIHWPIACMKDDDMMPLRGPDGKYVLDVNLTHQQEITWRAMEHLYDRGLTKSIGVSNWTISGLKELLKHTRVKPSVNQVEIHPFLPNTALLDYCNSQNIILEAYSPLGKLAVGERLSAVPELSDIVERTGFSLAQTLIAWGIRRGYVVLPKSFTPERIESNFRLVHLSQEDFEAINTFASKQKTRLVNIANDYGIDVWAEGE
jgi:diketogulonate reductase-like aldo/keto reductase